MCPPAIPFSSRSSTNAQSRLSSLHPDFAKWFPSALSFLPASSPRLRLICFPGSGMEQLVFTGKGTVRAPQPNPLVEYCKSEDIELLAVQLPGRSQRFKESPCRSTKEVAAALLDVLQPLLTDTVPYALLGHSMGCWCVYDLVRLIKEGSKKGLRPPLHLFLSSMISPDTPEEERPWKRSAHLTDKEFREEVQQWDVNTEVFEESMWAVFEPLLRNDFKLFDEFTFVPYIESIKAEATNLQVASSSSPSFTESSSFSPLNISATLWYAEKDHRIGKEDVMKWKAVLCGREVENGGKTDSIKGQKEIQFEVRQVQNATHAFLYDKTLREAWMKEVIDKLEMIFLELDYGC